MRCRTSLFTFLSLLAGFAALPAQAEDPAPDSSRRTTPEAATAAEDAGDAARFYRPLNPFAYGERVFFQAELNQQRLHQAQNLGLVDNHPGPQIRFVQNTSQPDPGLGQPFDPGVGQPLDTGLGQPFDTGIGDPFGMGTPSFDLPTLPDTGGSAEQVTGSQLATTQVQDIGGALNESNAVQTINVQRRSPIAQDPSIRGYRFAQIYTQADGQWWKTTRPDLDSMLSKLDPSLLRDITILPGPYSSRYGPALSYLIVDTVPTPRYCNGYESHAVLGFNWRMNGDQTYGYATALGGGADWGYILNWSSRIGSDYEAGNGQQIPSSYNAQNELFQVGFDISENSSVEFRYRRLDQTDTEVAGQFFDVGYLPSDSFGLNFTRETEGRLLFADLWYNFSTMDGDTRNASKQPIIDRVRAALAATPEFGNNVDFVGDTNGGLYNTGARLGLTIGEEGDYQLTTGGDFRFYRHWIDERFLFGPDTNGDENEIRTQLPKSQYANVGVFTETIIPTGSFLTTRAGARVDFVTTEFEEGLRTPSNLMGQPDSAADVLWSFYVTNEWEHDEYTTFSTSFGHGQRPPSLVERYSDGLFLAVIQSGLSRVIGDPTLRPERAWQVDLGVHWDYPCLRAGLVGYYSWVIDYVTFEGNEITDPSGARLLFYTNTPLATLWGYESFVEWDYTHRLTFFGGLNYTQGWDQTIGQPLPGIFPLEGRAGVRLKDPWDQKTWGVEFGARIADNQDLLGRIRTRNSDSTITVEDETPGFTTFYLRGYYNVNPNFYVVAGIENLFDRSYQEHRDLRLPADEINGDAFGPLKVLSPGFTPYLGFEITR